MIIPTAPGSRDFPQFAHMPAPEVKLEDEDERGVMELLDLDEDIDTANQAPETNRKRADALLDAQAYINRLLASVSMLDSAREARLATDLSLHSFRRVGAMHANTNYRINPLGGLLSAVGGICLGVNRTFVYMLNTTQEDQHISRQLSRWDPQTRAKLIQRQRRLNYSPWSRSNHCSRINFCCRTNDLKRDSSLSKTHAS